MVMVMSRMSALCVLHAVRIRDLAWQHTVALAGMRGALSVALALGLPADLPYRPQIIDTVYGVVFLTLIGQGLAIGPLLRRLRLEPQPV